MHVRARLRVRAYVCMYMHMWAYVAAFSFGSVGQVEPSTSGRYNCMQSAFAVGKVKEGAGVRD